MTTRIRDQIHERPGLAFNDDRKAATATGSVRVWWTSMLSGQWHCIVLVTLSSNSTCEVACVEPHPSNALEACETLVRMDHPVAFGIYTRDVFRD